MVKQQIRTKCNDSGLSKFVYLTSMTLLTAGIILECIMLHLMLSPYLEEQHFRLTECFYLNSSRRLVKVELDCENRCTKEEGSFPCIWIRVAFEMNTVDGKAIHRAGYLYDYYRTYHRYKSKKCTTSPCNQLSAENSEWVIAFDRTLFSRHSFPCHYNTKDLESVLLYKLYPKNLIFHTIFWPLVLLVTGLIGVIITGLLAGCEVWKTEDVVIA